MNVEVGRIRIACRSTVPDSSWALAVRTRLFEVASGSLADALDRVLAVEDADVTVDRLVAPLDFDPLEHDAETIATLWADRIQAALRATLAGVTAQLRTVPEPGTVAGVPAVAPDAMGAPRPSAGPVTPAQARELARLLAAADPPALRRAASRLLGAPGPLVRFHRLLRAVDRARVLDALAKAAAPPTARMAHAPASTADTASPGQPPADSLAGGQADDQQGGSAEAAWLAAWRALDEPAQTADTVHHTALDDRLAALVERVVARAGPLARDEAVETRVGGLALLYPWLGEHLTRAAEESPLPPIDTRRQALANIASPKDPLIQHDPLVHVLAGSAPDARTTYVDALGNTQVADRLLCGWAQLLPGLESATPRWLRLHLLTRHGWLTEADDEIWIDLAASPFDPLVVRLPYPLGTFRLAWTPVLHIRMEVQ